VAASRPAAVMRRMVEVVMVAPLGPARAQLAGSGSDVLVDWDSCPFSSCSE